MLGFLYTIFLFRFYSYTHSSILTLLGSGHKKPVWNLPVPNVRWVTPDDGQGGCPKHVEFCNRKKVEIVGAPGWLFEKKTIQIYYSRPLLYATTCFDCPDQPSSGSVAATPSHHSHNSILKFWIYIKYVRDTVNLNIFKFFVLIFLSWHNSPLGAQGNLMVGASRTHWHATVGRTPLDVWLTRSRDLYFTTHNTHDRQPCPRRDSNPQSQKAKTNRPTP